MKKELKIFVTATGRYIAGNVKLRKQPHIFLEGAAFVEIAGDQVRFLFSPIKFVPGLFKMYVYGLLGEMDMPEIMLPGYMEYLKTLPGKEATKKRK